MSRFAGVGRPGRPRAQLKHEAGSGQAMAHGIPDRRQHLVLTEAPGLEEITAQSGELLGRQDHGLEMIGDPLLLQRAACRAGA